jgi:hypothetical protein
MGSKVGEPLHQTIKPADWWMDKLACNFDIYLIKKNAGHVTIKVLPKEE